MKWHEGLDGRCPSQHGAFVEHSGPTPRQGSHGLDALLRLSWQVLDDCGACNHETGQYPTSANWTALGGGKAMNGPAPASGVEE